MRVGSPGSACCTISRPSRSAVFLPSRSTFGALLAVASFARSDRCAGGLVGGRHATEREGFASAITFVMEAEYRFDGSILASHRATRSSFRRLISTAMSRRFLPAPRVQADCGAQAGTCLDNPPLRRKCSLSLRQAQIPSRRWRALRRTRCRRHQGDEAGVRPSLQIRRPTMLNGLAISIGAVGLG
jgi:hypothetical protein